MWRDATYDALIRELLAQDVLASRDSVPVRLPPDRFDFAEAAGASCGSTGSRAPASTSSATWTTSARVRPDPDKTWRDPDRVSPKLQLGAALDALTVMTREAAERTDRPATCSDHAGCASGPAG